VTEQADIENDYFPQTKLNCLIYSWLTVYVVFTCVHTSQLISYNEKHIVKVQPIILNQLEWFRCA